MEETRNTVTHDGMIINAENGFAHVRILVHSGCASCQIKGACNVSEQSEKIIEVPTGNTEYKVGEKVQISMAQSLGFKALFFGYLLPFLIILTVLLIGSVFLENEGAIAGLSLFIAMIYYLILYFNRDKMKKAFTYKLKKLSI